MDDKTLKALKLSIEKWEKIVDCEGEDTGGGNCALCHMFDDGCLECPIAIKTNTTHCRKTPYVQWGIESIGRIINDDNGIYTSRRVSDKKSYDAAIAELNFLKSLLPKEK